MKTTTVLIGAAAAGAAFVYLRRGRDPGADLRTVLRRCDDASRRLELRLGERLSAAPERRLAA